MNKTERLTEKGFKFTSDYVASKLQSWSIAQCLNKLQQYEDLEEQGLIVRLPCPKGTTVYVIEEDYNEPYSKYLYINECAFEIGMLDYIGKTVFLTKEEAEEALKKMREE